MLAVDARIELFVIAFAVLAVATHAVVFVKLRAMLKVIARADAVVRVHRQLRDILGHVRDRLRAADFRRQRKRIHRRVVAVQRADVGELLDDDGVMLPGDLREGAVVQTPAIELVAGRADLIDLDAIFMVRGQVQRLVLFATALVPGRGIDSALGQRGQRQRDQGSREKMGFHEDVSFRHSAERSICESHAAIAVISSSLAFLMVPNINLDWPLTRTFSRISVIARARYSALRPAMKG